MTDMSNRLFDLPECKGTYQCKGIISGVARDKFYTSKATKTGKDFRAVNFGCAYDDKKNVYMSLNGMPQQKVYFSKRNPSTGKTETKSVAWADRNKFNEDGWRMIGVGLGLKKTTNSEGKEVNDKKTMTPFDACGYIKDNLQDDMSTFIRGNIEFSSYMDSEGNVRRSVKYVPNQISLCKEVDFSEYNEDNKSEYIMLFNEKLADFRKQFYQAPIEDISQSIGVGDYKKYVIDDKNSLVLGKQCPVSVQAIARYNYLAHKNGEDNKIQYSGKIKYYNIRIGQNNGYFGYPAGELPDWAPPMDKQVQWQKNVIDPINRFLEVMNIPLANAGILSQPIQPNLFDTL